MADVPRMVKDIWVVLEGATVLYADSDGVKFAAGSGSREINRGLCWVSCVCNDCFGMAFSAG